MKIGKPLQICALLLLGMSTSAVSVAAQSGGVPSLDARVSTLETTVASQGTAGAALQLQVNTVKSDVGLLQGRVATLEGQLPMFAVVDEDGTLRAKSGVQSAEHFLDSSGHPIAGAFKVFFVRSVSLCAVTVTAEPSFGAPITAIINGTFRGGGGTVPANEFTVELFDADGDRIDVRFNIIALC